MGNSNETKSLWGQDIEIVKWGLSEEQVSEFVADLIKQRDSLIGKQQHLSSLQMLAEKTVTEANALADQIKQEAHSQAERVLEEAEERAQETTGEAQTQADKAVSEANELVEQTLTEANELSEKQIAEANALAEQTKDEAQGQAIKVLEEAEEKSHETLDEAHSQADKTVAEANELSEKTIAEANELAEQTKQVARDRAARVVEEAEEKAREVVDEAQSQAEAITQENTTRILEQAEQEATAIIETAKEQVLTEIEDFRDRFHSRLQHLVTEIGTVKEVMEQTGIQRTEEDDSEYLPFFIPTSEASSNGDGKPFEAENDFESDLALLMADNGQMIEETTAVDQADDMVIPSPVQEDDMSLLQGEIEIAMAPPVNMAQLIRFRRNLQQVDHLKIVRTTGSWKEGSVTTAIIDQELPLINLLAEMPEVEKAELWTNAEANNGDSLEANRIIVTLKDEAELSDKVLEEWL